MPLDPAVVRRLQQILAPDRVVTDGPELALHARDALRPFRGRSTDEPLASHPDAVVFPRSTEEVIAVVRLAVESRTPIIPYGGGTGLMGGARSPRGGMVVDLKQLDRVLEVSPVDRTVVVQAGVVLADLDAVLAEHGLMLGHDPWTLSIATVGGAISTDSLGYLAGRYGSMGDQVLGLAVVLADGRLLRTRAVPRRSAGVDLERLFVAAEGTLGIVVEATLRAFPRPERQTIVGYRFPDFAAGFETLVGFEAIALRPAMLDFGENPPEVESTLYLLFQGFTEEVAAAAERADRICRAAGGTPIPRDEPAEFWEARHEIAERYRETSRQLDAEAGPARASEAFDFVHVALLPSRVLEYRERGQAIAARHGVEIREAGLWVHPGLFSLVLFHPGGTREPAAVVMARAVDDLLSLAQDLGGSMEYCHGVGTKLAHLMGRELDTGLDVLRAIKRGLDPTGILNPGKLGL